MERVRIGVLGCGSVSRHYLADLRQSRHVELAAVADADRERARAQAAEFGVPRACGGLDELLETPLDLLINLTPMPIHYALNLQALEAGVNILSEKPLAQTYEEARHLVATAERQGVRLWGAPTVVTSAAFAALAEALAAGRLGRVHTARGLYGHPGPSWGPWFYGPGGGVIFDLGVYNLTTLTGLLGPARGVVALTGTVVGEREVEGRTVQVEAEDTAAILLDHGDATFSCVQTGFNYGPYRQERSLEILGSDGSATVRGWDWGPRGVEIWDAATEAWALVAVGEGYSWEQGGSYLARCLLDGTEPLMTTAHAVHVVEVMAAAHESSATGRRIEIVSTFDWPIVGR